MWRAWRQPGYRLAPHLPSSLRRHSLTLPQMASSSAFHRSINDLILRVGSDYPEFQPPTPT